MAPPMQCGAGATNTGGIGSNWQGGGWRCTCMSVCLHGCLRHTRVHVCAWVCMWECLSACAHPRCMSDTCQMHVKCVSNAWGLPQSACAHPRHFPTLWMQPLLLGIAAPGTGHRAPWHMGGNVHGSDVHGSDVLGSDVLGSDEHAALHRTGSSLTYAPMACPDGPATHPSWHWTRLPWTPYGHDHHGPAGGPATHP